MGQAIKLEKVIIVVPRKAAMGEVSNNHQFITAKQLQAEGKIIVAWDTSELPSKITEAGTFVPVQECGDEKIMQAVDEFISKLAKRKVKR